MNTKGICCGGAPKLKSRDNGYLAIFAYFLCLTLGFDCLIYGTSSISVVYGVGSFVISVLALLLALRLFKSKNT